MVEAENETYYNACILKDILNVSCESDAHKLGKEIQRDDLGTITHIGGKKVYRNDNSVVFRLEEKYAPLTAFRVHLDNGASYETNCAAGITLAQATAYFKQGPVNMALAETNFVVRVEQIG